VSKNMRVKNQYLIVFSVFCIFQVFCVLCANDSGNLRHFKRCLAPRVVWMIGRQKRAFLKQVRVILFVCVWSIWKLRTGKIFNNREINLEEWWRMWRFIFGIGCILNQRVCTTLLNDLWILRRFYVKLRLEISE
jgi:hypothetical protein